MLSKRRAWPLAALWVLALLAYSNSFQGGLVFDNATAILRDTRVHALTQQNVHLILNEEYWYNSSTTGLYRPLTTFSYLLNYAVLGSGPNPAGYHWLNFLIHAANISLVYLVGLYLFEDLTLAIALAALWGLHPLLTESVSNIVGRADLMAAFGVLAGLVCHMAAARATGRRKWLWLAGLAAAAAIGIFSKEAGAVLPGVMLLHDLTWPRRAAWTQRLPGYAAMAVPFAIFLTLRADLHARLPVGLIPYIDNPLFGLDFGTARLTAIKIMGKYVALFFWPAHQSADYSYNSLSLTVNGWTFAAVALCAGAVAAMAVCHRKAKPLFFFLGLFFVTLAPTANVLLLIGSIMAERFVYLPCLGLAGCVVAMAARPLKTQPRIGLAAAGVVCVALAVCTWLRNPVWHDDISLWTSVAQAYPENLKAHSTLAESGADVGEADKTLAIAESLPDEWSTSRPYATVGKCYRAHGEYQKALAALLHGQKVEAHELAEIHRLNLEHGKSVLAAGWMPLYLELGRVYIALREPQKAMEPLAYGRAHSADPEFTVETAHALEAAGSWEQAAILLMEAIEEGSTSPRFTAELVDLYKRAAPASCAIRQTAGATSLDPNCPLVRGHLCAASSELTAAYRDAGQPDKAQALATAAANNFGCR